MSFCTKNILTITISKPSVGNVNPITQRYPSSTLMSSKFITYHHSVFQWNIVYCPHHKKMTILVKRAIKRFFINMDVMYTILLIVVIDLRIPRIKLRIPTTHLDS